MSAHLIVFVIAILLAMVHIAYKQANKWHQQTAKDGKRSDVYVTM